MAYTKIRKQVEEFWLASRANAFKISAKAFVAFVSHPFHKWNGNDQNSLPFGFSQRSVDKKRTGFSPILNVKPFFNLKAISLLKA
ncbi:MAG: hypothetical protein V4560_07350 [Bacteroidota bacterium]